MSPTSNLPPWEARHPALTERRLKVIAEIIITWRHRKLALRQLADSSWNLGCDQYQWACYGIQLAAEGDNASWLECEPHGLEFLFKIAGVPCKVFHDGVPGQPERTARRSSLEEDALQIALQDFLPPLPSESEGVFRFAVDTDESGAVKAVRLVELDDTSNVLYEWPIPVDVAPVHVVGIRDAAGEGVELGPPRVEMPAQEQPKQAGEDEGDRPGRKQKGA